MKALLINPWIYDFAAANLWARPLGLLKAAELLSTLNLELSLIDCMEVPRKADHTGGKYPKETVEKPECIKSVPRQFGRYGISIGEFREALKQNEPFDLVLMTSIMSYWYPGVREAIAIVKELYRDMPVVLGGIYATLWARHASETSGADFIYRGKVREDIRFVFQTFGFRVKKIRAPQSYYQLGLYGQLPFAAVLTGQGCPFRCSYCASVLLSDGFIQKAPAEVCREISGLAAVGIRDFAFYDDALLANPDAHIKPILNEVIRSGQALRFHCPNGLHAGFMDDELASLMKVSGFRTIRLGLETTNSRRQEETGGKVSSDTLERAVRSLKKQGFTKNEIGVYLMYGLPGQGLDEVAEGVRFLKSLGVRIHLNEYSPIPGTSCWDGLVKTGVIRDSIDPLLTNNSVFSFLYSGYDPDEVRRLKLEVKDYNIS